MIYHIRNSSRSVKISEIEVSRIDWSGQRCCGGLGVSGCHVPEMITQFLQRDSTEELGRIVNRLEVTYFPQRTLFQGAEPFASVLPAIICDKPTVNQANFVLEMFFEIAQGYVAPEESALGDQELAERCFERLLEGKFLLY